MPDYLHSGLRNMDGTPRAPVTGPFLRLPAVKKPPELSPWDARRLVPEMGVDIGRAMDRRAEPAAAPVRFGADNRLTDKEVFGMASGRFPAGFEGRVTRSGPRIQTDSPLADAIGTGLGVGTSVLDSLSGSRGVRGLVSGNPREAFSVFAPGMSDSLGITNPAQNKYGRAILEDKELMSRSDPWGQVKGFAADMVLSPQTLAGIAGAPGKLLRSGASGSADDMIKPSLGLKYDDMDLPPEGMIRTDPEWLNNRTFYHGTATPGLTAENIDVMKTDPNALFGRGFYTTSASGDTPRGYARGRASNIDPKDLDIFGKGFGGQVYQYQPNLARKVLDLDYPTSDADLFKGIVDNSVSAFSRALEGIPGHSPENLKKFISAYGSPYRMALYKGKRDFAQRSSDATVPVGRKMMDLRKTLGSLAGDYRESRPLVKGLSGVDESYYNAIAAADPVVSGLRESGYDALTHTGGLRTSAGRSLPPHQVLIHLDPTGRLGGANIPNTVKDLSVNYNVLRDWGDRFIAPSIDDADFQKFIGSPSPILGSGPQPGGRGLGGSRFSDPSLKFPMAKEFGRGDWRVVGANSIPQMKRAMDAADAIKGQNFLGAYVPKLRAAAVLSDRRFGKFGSTVRHERFHGIVDSARRNNALDKLPFSMRTVGKMQESKSPFLRTLGRAGEETLAQGIEKRGFGPQLAEMSGFLLGVKPRNFKTRAYYRGVYGQESPLAAALFDNAYRVRDPKTYLAATALGTGLGAASAYPGSSNK